MTNQPQAYVAVVGPGHLTAGDPLLASAYEVGAALATAGAAVVTGGLGGVMAAACRGAADAGGLTLGLLPGTDRAAANPWLTLSVPSGLGEARNALVVRSADAVIAVGGSWGTLSEVALARRLGRVVISLAGWSVQDSSGAAVGDGSTTARDPTEAVRAALAAVRQSGAQPTHGA